MGAECARFGKQMKCAGAGEQVRDLEERVMPSWMLASVG